MAFSCLEWQDVKRKASNKIHSSSRNSLETITTPAAGNDCSFHTKPLSVELFMAAFVVYFGHKFFYSTFMILDLLLLKLADAIMWKKITIYVSNWGFPWYGKLSSSRACIPTHVLLYHYYTTFLLKMFTKKKVQHTPITKNNDFSEPQTIWLNENFLPAKSEFFFHVFPFVHLPSETDELRWNEVQMDEINRKINN